MRKKRSDRLKNTDVDDIKKFHMRLQMVLSIISIIISGIAIIFILLSA